MFFFPNIYGFSTKIRNGPHSVPYISFSMPVSLIPSCLKSLIFVNQFFSLRFDLYMKHFIELHTIIDCHEQQYDPADNNPESRIIPVNKSNDLSMQESNDDHCIKSPGDRALQTNDPFIIKRFVIIVPP